MSDDADTETLHFKNGDTPISQEGPIDLGVILGRVEDADFSGLIRGFLREHRLRHRERVEDEAKGAMSLFNSRWATEKHFGAPRTTTRSKTDQDTRRQEGSSKNVILPRVHAQSSEHNRAYNFRLHQVLSGSKGAVRRQPVDVLRNFAIKRVSF